MCDTHIWTEIDLESCLRNYYVNRQVRAMFLGDAYQSKPSFEIFKYLIKKKNPVYGWQRHYDVIPTYE